MTCIVAHGESFNNVVVFLDLNPLDFILHEEYLANIVACFDVTVRKGSQCSSICIFEGSDEALEAGLGSSVQTVEDRDYLCKIIVRDVPVYSCCSFWVWAIIGIPVWSPVEAALCEHRARDGPNHRCK